MAAPPHDLGGPRGCPCYSCRFWSQVFASLFGRPKLTTTNLTEDQGLYFVEQMLKSSGRRLDLSSPFVDAALPGGECLHFVIPTVTRRHASVHIRRFVMRASLSDLVAARSLTSRRRPACPTPASAPD